MLLTIDLRYQYCSAQLCSWHCGMFWNVPPRMEFRAADAWQLEIFSMLHYLPHQQKSSRFVCQAWCSCPSPSRCVQPTSLSSSQSLTLGRYRGVLWSGWSTSIIEIGTLPFQIEADPQYDGPSLASLSPVGIGMTLSAAEIDLRATGCDSGSPSAAAL